MPEVGARVAVDWPRDANGILTTVALVEEYLRLKREHSKAVRLRVARVTLGSSVMRVFRRGTRIDLLQVLAKLPIEDLSTIKTQRQFKNWFEKQLEAVAQGINRKNRRHARVQPGAKWGHGTKVLAIFLREMVAHSRTFSDQDVHRIEALLYVPLDRLTMDRLQKLGVKLTFRFIREIDSAEKFYRVQAELGKAASAARAPRVWFDDNWGDRQS